MENKSFWERVISSDANLTFLMLNVCGIMWYVTLNHTSLPDGMVTLVLGIFTGKTVHGVITSKNGNGNSNGHSILSALKPKKPS